MAQRRRGKVRCMGCGLNEMLCACHLVPTLRFDTPLVIVQAMRERFKPTNTGRLLARMVEGTPIVHFGQRDPPFDTSWLDASAVDFRVLFPREDAQVLHRDLHGVLQPASSWGKKRGFVLLDGTWHQCSRMSRRVPTVRDLACVALPPGPTSIWTVRTQHDRHGLSTFEAGLRLLELLEGEEAVRPMRTAFEIINHRLAFMKGRCSSPDPVADDPG